MFAFFFVSALLHLLLGAAIAVVYAHDERELLAWLPNISFRRKPRVERHNEPAEAEPVASESVATETASPAIAPADVIPEEWKVDSNTTLRSPAEAAMWFMFRRTLGMRERLFAIDRILRAVANQVSKEEIRKHYDEALAFLAEWASSVSTVSQTLASRFERLSAHVDFAKRFNEYLLDHVSRVASIRERISGELTDDEPQESLRRLRDDLIQALAAVEQMKAQAEDSHAVVRSRDKSLAESGEEWLGGGELQLYTRLGAEHRFSLWCQEDPDRTRPSCGAAVRLDRVENFRDRFGMDATEKLTQSLAEVVASALRRKRGDFAVAIDPATIFMFLANSPAREGKNASERVRQTIEATEFQLEGKAISLTVCCAVCEPTLDDGPGDLIQRLDAGLQLVHRSGGNRTAVDEGNGPALIDPITVEVKARTVVLD